MLIYYSSLFSQLLRPGYFSILAILINGITRPPVCEADLESQNYYYENVPNEIHQNVYRY